jgi:predicted RNA binding protein YcfA (HicA-like mRNA interferase family)
MAAGGLPVTAGTDECRPDLDDPDSVNSTLEGSARASLRIFNRRAAMPPEVRDLVAALERAGFVDRGGRGSYRNYIHPLRSLPVTISGKLGDDAKPYQVRAIRKALEEPAKR